ncbi:MAG: hypothetical protein FWD71_08830 [Oscillospiraceae bacterium]|nr:hypothetical protein [Oscillospiraceae bacterium]
MTEKQILAILKSLREQAEETLMSTDWEDIWVSQAIPWIDTYNKLRKITISKGWLDNEMVENDLISEIDTKNAKDEDGAELLCKVKWFSSLLSAIIDKSDDNK